MKLKIKNPKVLVLSLIALGFVVLAFLVSPYFLIGAVIIALINQKELMKIRKQ